jgi:hypothetical protein
LPCWSGSACPGKVSFTGFGCLSAPSPCERPYRLRVLWADPTPEGLSASLLHLDSDPPTCSWIGSGQRPNAPTHDRNPSDLPSSWRFSPTHATLFVDPGRPSESSPIRSLCVGFWYRYTIATCFILGNEAVSRLQGLRSPLRPMWFPVYASAVSFGSLTSSTTATLGTGGWLSFTRQGLPPCKKRQASWRTTVSSSAARDRITRYQISAHPWSDAASYYALSSSYFLFSFYLSLFSLSVRLGFF